LAGLPTAKAQIENADVVALSIGGNDYLIPFLAIIDQYKGEGETYDDALNNMKKDALNVAAKFNATVPTQTDPAIANIKSIVASIKATNPNAKITLCSLYNPIEALLNKGTAAVMLNSQVKPMLEDFNTKLAAIEGVTVLPVGERFTGNVAVFTNVPAYDVHPNDAGQIKIASLLAAAISDENEDASLRAVLLSRYTDEQISALPAALTNGLDLTRYLGDANNDGEVDSNDASLILKYDAGDLSEARIDLNNSDTNADEEADSNDARLVLMYDAGMISAF
ncbi:MAG: hypothetical protein IJS94_01045, partial [Clostridia bacterium]|nr:hypothetical protein [Clostridia bacterium]